MKIEVRCFESWHSSYDVEGDFGAGQIRVSNFNKTSPSASNFSGIGSFVWHSNFRKIFWCVYVYENVLRLVVGQESFKVDEASFSLCENFFTSIFSAHCGAAVKAYSTLQPWIRKPWLLVDAFSYDGIDHEMESFPAYLNYYLKRPEWQHYHWPQLVSSL